MALTQSGGRSVVAVYPDLETARRAMTGLEARGIDGADVQLVGEGAARAATTTDVHERDLAVASRVGRGSLAGMAIGAIAGALAGLVVAFAVDVQMPAVFVLAGAVIGVFFGMAVGGWSRLRATADWDLTFEPAAQGEVAIAVRSLDGATLDGAADALRTAGALRVELH